MNFYLILSTYLLLSCESDPIINNFCKEELIQTEKKKRKRT